MDLVKNGTLSIVNIIRNMPYSGTREEIQISQILFLDCYFRQYINFECGVLDVMDAQMMNNIELYNSLYKKYEYAFNGTGIFREKKSGDDAIAELASDVLRRLGIQCNVVKGAIVLNSINGTKIYPHSFNEIKLNDKWYCYDFSFNIISEKWKTPEVKNALKFIKMPVTPVDYSFVNNIGKNAMIGGYDTSKKGSKEFNPSFLTRDFSKYTLMDRFLVLSKYQNIQKLIKAMNINN